MSTYFKRKKDPHEKAVLTFDFSSELAAGETLTGTPTVSVSLEEGADPNPSDLLNGDGAINSATITRVNGTTIAIASAFQQPVKAGVSGCVYGIEVICETTNSNKVLAFTGLLRVAEGA